TKPPPPISRTASITQSHLLRCGGDLEAVSSVLIGSVDSGAKTELEPFAALFFRAAVGWEDTDVIGRSSDIRYLTP
ncbi:MAG: hypothetical protein HWQ41_09100, partial [Nostoc sp. NOS(2021)]|nr:hypothetical protein [Nostoc sp. NOS(2021)]